MLNSLRHLGIVSKFYHCAVANLCHNVEENPLQELCALLPIAFLIAKHCTILQKGLTACMGDGRILQKISAPFKNKTTNELTSFQPDLSRMTVSSRRAYKLLQKRSSYVLKN
jgi:hypothetical protein